MLHIILIEVSSVANSKQNLCMYIRTLGVYIASDKYLVPKHMLGPGTHRPGTSQQQWYSIPMSSLKTNKHHPF